MPGTRLEDEYVSTLTAGIATIDPAIRLQPLGYQPDLVTRVEGDGQVDDRLGE